jgi:hypothetical protein
MFHQHNKLLLADESLEAGVIRIVLIPRCDDRSGTLPSDILRLREQIMHELFLTRELDLYMSLAEPTTATSSSICLETIDCSNSFIQAHKLDVAIKSLACHTLHDDVDGFVFLFTDDTSVTAKEGKNFGTVDRVRNLRVVSWERNTKDEMTYVLDLDHTPSILLGQSTILRKRQVMGS